MGSKNKIAKWIVDLLPSGKRFVDLFAGGCAVTHCAMLSGKWENFVVNDICDAPKLFIDAINGKYNNEKRWISRERFFELKDSDPYVRYVWSFGCRGDCYIYGADIEPHKRAAHYAVMYGDFNELNVLHPEIADTYRKK